MTNLGIAGAVSLGTVNQWISLIDTNLTNSKRIGYKETRVSMTSGEVNTVGMTQGPGKIMPIAFPSASLLIGKTQILDYVQGNLTQTGQITDFALNGKGYFVVEDDLGNRYATRDGQFNFDADGYLVTQEGLRVLSAGMDYIRVPASETFAVNTSGESQSNVIDPSIVDNTFNVSAGVSSLSTSIYGTKKLLVIEIPDSDKLVYSKYGYTKFELGKRVPIIVRNDFSKTTDGIDTSLIPDYLVDAGFATGTSVQRKMADYFRHDLKNGMLKISPHQVNGTANRYVQAAVTGQKYQDFNLDLDFFLQDVGPPSDLAGFNAQTNFGITFGKSEHSSTNLDSYFVGLEGGQLVLKKNNGAPIASVGLPNLTVDSQDPLAFTDATKISLKVEVVNGVFNAQLYQNNILIPGAQLSNVQISNYSGYMSLGNTVNQPSGNAAGNSDNMINIKNLTVIERNQDSKFTQNILQQNIKDIWKDGINAQERETMVMQQYVEESTSTIADTLPLLSHAQKMFSAISKVISVYGTITDDMNNTLR